MIRYLKEYFDLAAHPGALIDSLDAPAFKFKGGCAEKKSGKFRCYFIICYFWWIDHKYFHMLTVHKIGGTSMSKFEDVLRNIVIGQAPDGFYYNRIFVVSAYNQFVTWL